MKNNKKENMNEDYNELFKEGDILVMQESLNPLLENLNIASQLESIVERIKRIPLHSRYLEEKSNIILDLHGNIAYFQIINKPILKEIIEIFYSRGQEESKNAIPSKNALEEKVKSLIYDYSIEVQLISISEDLTSLKLNSKAKKAKERIVRQLQKAIYQLNKQSDYINGLHISISQ